LAPAGPHQLDSICCVTLPPGSGEMVARVSGTSHASWITVPSRSRLPTCGGWWGRKIGWGRSAELIGI